MLLDNLNINSIKYNMENKFSAFGEQKIKEIRLWAWAAAIMPITALASMFFIWYFGSQTVFSIAMVVGATFMFAVAVFWWWWVLHSLYSLLQLWKRTDSHMEEVKTDLRAIRETFRNIFRGEDK